MDSTFHSFLELDDKHAGAVKAINEKLSTAETKLNKSAERIKELENDKKILEKEKSELNSRCQRYDENEQQHKHDIEKMRLSHIQKSAEMKVLDLDTTNLKKQKATQSQLDNGRDRIETLSKIITSSRNNTPTDFSALVRPQQHEPSAVARTEALQTITAHYQGGDGVPPPQQQYTNHTPVGNNVGVVMPPPQQQYTNHTPFGNNVGELMLPSQQYPNQNMQPDGNYAGGGPQQQYPNQHLQPVRYNVGGGGPQQQYPNQTSQLVRYNVGGGGLQQQLQPPPQQQYPNQNMQRFVYYDGGGGAGDFGRFCLLHIRIL